MTFVNVEEISNYYWYPFQILMISVLVFKVLNDLSFPQGKLSTFTFLWHLVSLSNHPVTICHLVLTILRWGDRSKIKLWRIKFLTESTVWIPCRSWLEGSPLWRATSAWFCIFLIIVGSCWACFAFTTVFILILTSSTS